MAGSGTLLPALAFFLMLPFCVSLSGCCRTAVDCVQRGPDGSEPSTAERIGGPHCRLSIHAGASPVRGVDSNFLTTAEEIPDRSVYFSTTKEVGLMDLKKATGVLT